MKAQYHLYRSLLMLSIIKLMQCLSSSLLESSVIQIDDQQYSKTEVSLLVQKTKSNIYIMNGIYLPSDLINQIKTGDELELSIIQGSLANNHRSTFYSFNIPNNTNRLTDYPSGYFLHSKQQLSPFNDIERFKTFFDLFTNVFKLTMTPLLDRGEFIVINNETFLIESKEKACIEHLDAIKETLPHHQWSKYLTSVNYTQFTYSDYKTVRYYINANDDWIKFTFEIISRLIKPINHPHSMSFAKYSNEELLSSHRYLEGIRFNFENFVFHHIIVFDKGYSFPSIFHSNKSMFKFIEIIPSMLNPLFSTMKIMFYHKDVLVKTLLAEDMSQLFDIQIIEGIENQYPQVPFTYEQKRNKKIVFCLRINPYFLFDTIELTIVIKKTILNFESLDNEEEFGFIMPSGLIIVGDKYAITNHVYFNMPNVDITMPFNIIAVSWLIFGFMFVQILNIFLGKTKGKSILDSIKERFCAKWGFLWGR